MAAYLELYREGKLPERIEAAKALLYDCRVCPRHCGVNRLAGETGRCHTSDRVKISSYGPHFGEELPLVGNHGSGTIFCTNCNLQCIYCQNYTISQLGEGYEVDKEKLAQIMLSLQYKGCHNINLVSPTHVVPQIMEALQLAVTLGLNLPLVYNSGGYDSVETLKLLDGIVDIYMPDMKYSSDSTGKDLSDVYSYPDINRAAVKEMHRQVGDLQINQDGIAVRGLLLRHLVLPHDLAGSYETIQFIAQEISKNSYINIMDQYRPCYNASKFNRLNRPVSAQEFLKAIELAHEAGLHRLDRRYPAILSVM